MRPGGFVAVILGVCAAFGAACGGGGGATERVSGTANVPGAPAGVPLHLVVAALNGDVLGEGPVDATGRFDILAVIAADVRRVLVTVVLPEDPERRAVALVDVGGGFDERALPLEGGKADNGAAGGTTVDAESTATALVAAATGNLEQDLGALRARFPGPIATVKQHIETGTFPQCSVGASASADTWDPLAASLAEVTAATVPDNPEDPAVPELIRELVKESRRVRPVEQRLRNMQEMISQVVFSLNNPRIAGNADYILGVMPLVLLRTTIWGWTQEELGGISDAPLPRGELNRLAGMIAGIKWGNCREKAYLGAFAASLIPELRQIAVVGLETATGGAHAVAIACLDGPEVIDLKWYGGTTAGGSDFSIPPAAEGRCFVIDPWQGPEGDLTAGHTEVLDARSPARWGWNAVEIVKPVVLSGFPLTLTAALRLSSPLCQDGGCQAFVPPAPEPPPGGFDAGGGGGGEDVLQCPTYEPDGNGCGASLDGCIEGFYCSLETIACEQEVCPPGSGRTYTLECCCNCWDDQSTVNVYDPCRAGFLLRCDPAQ